jgi:hypothetical protein
MSIGYLPLLNALIDLWQKRAIKGDEGDDSALGIAHREKKNKWVNYVAWYV